MIFCQSLTLTRVEISHQSIEVLECLVKGPTLLRISVIYQPHRTTPFLEEFGTYLSSVLTSPGHLLVMGDFNIHVDDPSDRFAQEFLTMISSLGMQQHVTEPTHRSGHTLDLLLTPTSDPVLTSWESRDCGFRDHFAVFTKLNIAKPTLPRKIITYRKTKSITKEALQAVIISSQLTDQVFSSSMNEANDVRQ